MASDDVAPRDATGPDCLLIQYRYTFARPCCAGAAAPHVPPALIQQLAPGGRLVIPVGAEHGHQELRAVDKDANGRARQILPATSSTCILKYRF